ncbi:MAG: hypothetical protein WA064_05150 [Candidatus Moraniibacteriota bacterium]
METSEQVRLADLESAAEKLTDTATAAFVRGLFGTDNGGMYQVSREDDIMVVAKQAWSTNCFSGRSGGSTEDYSTRFAVVVDLSGNDPRVIGDRYGMCLYRTTHDGVIGFRMSTKVTSIRKAEGKLFIRFGFGENELEV